MDLMADENRFTKRKTYRGINAKKSSLCQGIVLRCHIWVGAACTLHVRKVLKSRY